MVLSKKIVSSIVVLFSIGLVYFRANAVSALGDTSNGALLPSTGDTFSIWPIIVGVFLVILALVLFLKKKI
ncbi:LPXTG cell wall anchor domain-containing protein [Listeria welshimeri]|uniref:LPXTG cell wall anchor domain-containing protein n=1 Tax=Listeria welshimeri TaxID=1643 RepID=UPI003D041ED6